MLEAFVGAARRLEQHRRAVTGPGVGQRGRWSFIGHLEADWRIGASTEDLEGGAALPEAPRCSGDQRRGFLRAEAAIRVQMSPEKMGQRRH